MFRVLALTAAVSLLAGSAAWADEAIATAGAGGVHAPTTTAEAPPLDPPAGAYDDDAMLTVNACGVATEPGQKADTKAHGAVEVGVGTGGYRHVRAAMCKPIGQDGAVMVDVSHTEWSRRARFAGDDARLLEGPSAP